MARRRAGSGADSPSSGGRDASSANAVAGAASRTATFRKRLLSIPAVAGGTALSSRFVASGADITERLRHASSSRLRLTRSGSTESEKERAARFPTAVATGLKRSGRDVYFFVVSRSWPSLILLCFAALVVASWFFAVIFAWPWSGESFQDCISGTTDDFDFLDAWALSVHTLSTVGYGSLYPERTCGFAEAVVLVESYVGMVLGALLTGVIFTKFSAPRSKIEVSRNMVIREREMHDGRKERVLEFRIGNFRGDPVWQAEVEVTIARLHTMSNGETWMKITDVPLERSSNQMLRYGWNLIHVIDESSPLYGFDEDSWRASGVRSIQVAVTGVDSVLMTQMFTREQLHPADVKFDHRFVDMVEFVDDSDPTKQRVTVHMERLHQVEPLPATKSSTLSVEDVPVDIDGVPTAGGSGGAALSTSGHIVDTIPEDGVPASLSGSVVSAVGLNLIELSERGEFGLFAAEDASAIELVLEEGAEGSLKSGQRLNMSAILREHRVAIFGVTGAFDPVCSSVHLPSILGSLPEMLQCGLDGIIIVVPNTVHVTVAWRAAVNVVLRGITDHVTFVADPVASLATRLGLCEPATHEGLRPRRFSGVVEDGLVLFVDADGTDAPADDVSCTGGHHIVSRLQSEQMGSATSIDEAKEDAEAGAASPSRE